jgi:hypothetical protein
MRVVTLQHQALAQRPADLSTPRTGAAGPKLSSLTQPPAVSFTMKAGTRADFLTVDFSAELPNCRRLGAKWTRVEGAPP